MYQPKPISTLAPNQSNSISHNQQIELTDNCMGPNNGGSNNLAARQRLRWTDELHEQFVDAVTQLGGPDSKFLTSSCLYSLFLNSQSACADNLLCVLFPMFLNYLNFYVIK
jgi:hypothetical protein